MGSVNQIAEPPQAFVMTHTKQHESLAFAHLDLDMYTPTFNAFKELAPLFKPGTTFLLGAAFCYPKYDEGQVCVCACVCARACVCVCVGVYICVCYVMMMLLVPVF